MRIRDTTETLITHRARGRMLTPCSAEITVRQFTRVTDERKARGGEDSAPTPLEHVLIALCG